MDLESLYRLIVDHKHNGLDQTKPLNYPDASASAKGMSKLSVAPASATNPIAVGDNDPRLTTPMKTVLITRDLTAATGAVATAHGLGRAPKAVTAIAIFIGSGLNSSLVAFGAYDGTNQVTAAHKIDATPAIAPQGNGALFLIIEPANNQIQQCTIAVDATNITLSWTKSNLPTGTAHIILMAH